MFNITRKFVSVFQPSIKLNSSKIVYANLSSSKKNTDVSGNISYKNSNWLNAKFVGKAFEQAQHLKHGDKIDILNGSVETDFNIEKQKLYVNVTIFEFVMSQLPNDDKYLFEGSSTTKEEKKEGVS